MSIASWVQDELVSLQNFMPKRTEPSHVTHARFPVRFRELAALKARLATLGYQDGVEDGVEEAVQEGFDKGYSMGAETGWDTGSLYGAAAAVAAALAQAASLGRDHQHPPPAESTALSGSLEVAPLKGERLEGDSDGQQPARDVPVTVTPAAIDSAASPSGGDLQNLVEKLKQACLSGPGGARVERVDVTRRLRLVGPSGVAVADGLGM